jgi:salicylate hydroxylase
VKEIVIAGAGIGGLTAALALRQQDFNVRIIEQTEYLSDIGAGLQLSPNAMHVMQALGIRQQLTPFVFRPKAAQMRHYQSAKLYFSVPLDGACVTRYGAEYVHIHRADLQSVLWQACQQAGVRFQFSESVVGYQQANKHVHIHLASGQTLQADCLIGADGIKSKVHSAMLGEQKARFTGQVAWRGTVPSQSLPKGLVSENANLWVGPGRHFVSYYVRSGEAVNFVAVEERDDWQGESWSEQGDVQQLRRAFAGWHPAVSEILAATQQCYLWALHDRAPLSRWTDGQVALLGDACHPMLPFLAQGAAMAIEDAYVLAAMLKKSTDINQELLQYQQIRLPRTTAIQIQARSNAALYHMSHPIERAKLAVLSGLSKLGLSDKLATVKLDAIYQHDVTRDA